MGHICLGFMPLLLRKNDRAAMLLLNYYLYPCTATKLQALYRCICNIITPLDIKLLALVAASGKLYYYARVVSDYQYRCETTTFELFWHILSRLST